MNAFWKIQRVAHLELTRHIRGTEMERLQGVFSKLQTFKLFAEEPWNLSRIVMMDANMILNDNCDEIFGDALPAAVMRGEADSSLHDKRPAATYFQEGRVESFTERGRR